MSQAPEQIIFFSKNFADYSNLSVTATASQGSDYASRVLNRNNISSWVTTGSVDADNTTLTIDLVDTHRISEILLLKHNFKAFTVKYWDGAAYQAFSPAINETANTDTSSRFTVTAQLTSKIQVTITGTQVANSDKQLYQVILTDLIGQLSGWPVIKKPTFDKNKQISKMLSGKINLTQNLGGFACDFTVKNWSSSADLTIVESLYGSNDGFLVWLCGGNESQFSSVRQGYRLEDLFLMRCVNNYTPEWVEGLYKTGLNLTLNLNEVVT